MVASLFCQREDMAALAVHRRVPGDDEELFRLYGEVFGQGMSAASRRRWQWQYLDNPATPPDGPEIWVAREDGALLGQYASMPVRLWWGGREVRSSWGMDVFLRAEARGKGVGARLFTAWSDHVEVALGLGLTPSSYGLFKKLRYVDVGPVPFYRKVLDARAGARRRLGALGPAVAPFLRGALAVRQREAAVDAGGRTVRRVDTFSEEYDGLWERARASYVMCVRRDLPYLRWKYQLCPERAYEIREARTGGTLAGFAVSRQEDYRGVRLGWVIDVFADGEDHATRDVLLRDVMEGFAADGVARAQAFGLDARLGAALERRGFRRGPSPMQFCVRARVDSDAVFARTDRWHVVFGDSDMDR
jgi:GNAT superfamily N-acetyltransferase